jgi:hypothetical protein
MYGVHHGVQRRIEELLRLFRVEVPDQLGRVFDVGKQDRDLLAFAFDDGLADADLLGEVGRSSTASCCASMSSSLSAAR